MIPRGIRNNNPGNIRIGNAWHGEQEYGLRTEEQKREKTFEVFVCATYGIRSIAKLLKNYQKKYRLMTIYGIIERYAPSTENRTDEYAEHVASIVGIDKGQYIDVTNPESMRKMLSGIILHENGIQPYSWEIEDGMLLAGVM